MVKLNLNEQYKKAFSLPEVLIVLAIVGLISVLTITQTRPMENLLGLQYRKVLRNLEIAAFNSHEDCIADSTQCSYMDTKSDLCNNLISYINFSEENCASGTFTATNSARYEVLDVFDIDQAQSIKGALVRVDINGINRKPNDTEWKRNVPADIVYFIINSYGEAAPLGNPRFDRRYIQAKVVYPNEEDNELSTPMVYGDAQRTAYGSSLYVSDIYSYTERINNIPITVPLQSSPIEAVQQSPSCVNREDNSYPTCTLEIVY